MWCCLLRFRDCRDCRDYLLRRDHLRHRRRHLLCCTNKVTPRRFLQIRLLDCNYFLLCRENREPECLNFLPLHRAHLPVSRRFLR